MYEVSVESSFNAAHQVHLPNGELEPLHGHDWSVQATYRSQNLDPSGMVVDFIAASQALSALTDPLEHTNLNGCPLLGDRTPTAELVARAIFDALAAHKPTGYALHSVSVVEAPGCRACYRRDTTNAT